jgi:hypothetical protein
MNVEMFQTTIDTIVVDDKLSSARCSLKFKTLDNNVTNMQQVTRIFNLLPTTTYV